MARYLSFRDGGKTDEEGISRYVSKIFDGEVIDGLLVTQQGPLALGITVESGDVMIPSGNDYPYIAWNDASFNITLATADGTNPRYDLIVAYIDLAVVQSTTPNNPDALVLDNVTGTPAGSPVEPNQAAIEAVIGVGNPYVILARVTVGAGVTTISNSVIVDRRDLLSVGVETAETAAGGWITPSGTFSVASGYNKGNKEFDVTTSTDLTAVIQPGNRVKIPRSTTPPTQCADLERSSSQFANRTASITGISFTDDFTIEQWIKLESYPASGTAFMTLSRLNAAASQGFFMQIGNDGAARVAGYTTAGGTNRVATTVNCLPKDEWIHLAGTMDMSAGTGVVYVNGVVYATVSSGTATSLIQAGDLAIGNFTSNTQYFDGKIADVRLWSVVRTATQIRDNMNQQLVGNETNLIGYWKLNGNFNDSHANANNLTAQGSAAATNVDNPMNSTEYAIVHKITSTTMTLFGGKLYNVPNMAIDNLYYSREDSPMGFNRERNNWQINAFIRQNLVYTASASAGVWYNANVAVSIPTGSWEAVYNGTVGGASAGAVSLYGTLSTNTSAETDDDFSYRLGYISVASTMLANYYVRKHRPLVITAQTVYYMLFGPDTAMNGGITLYGGQNTFNNGLPGMTLTSSYV